MVLGLVFTSCEPMDDIHAAIDAEENTIVGDAEYTLTDDDYETLGLSYGTFNNEEQVKASDIPNILSEVFPVWGKNSSVLVNYQLYLGKAFSAEDYYLTQDDYTLSGSDLLGFQSDATPGDYLADILANNIDYASEGDYAIAKYSQYSGAAYTITPTVTFEENFDYGAVTGDLNSLSVGNWESYSGTASQIEYATTSLSMDNYPTSAIGGSVIINGSDSEDVKSTFTEITSGTVYASTLINLSAVDDGNYFFHLKDDGYNFRARVGAKDDGSGNILFGIGASSSTLTYGTTSFDLGTTYLLVATYDIDNGISNLYVLTTAYATEPGTPEATNTDGSGTPISELAIRQSGGIPSGTLDGIRVANTWSAIMNNGVLDDEVIGDKTADQMLYTFNGSAWELAEDGSYVLTSEDYDAMGTDYGLPGKYNNFDSSMDVDAYISTFLGIKYPFAQNDDNIHVLYNYYDGGAKTSGNSYTVIDGVWVGYESVISAIYQYGHNGIAWEPDNTIKYTLVDADYEYIADQLSTDPDYIDILDSFVEHHNFSYTWEVNDSYDLKIGHALSILAAYLNPTAEVGQKYIFTYVLYDNGTNNVSMSLILTDAGWVLNN